MLVPVVNVRVVRVRVSQVLVPVRMTVRLSRRVVGGVFVLVVFVVNVTVFVFHRLVMMFVFVTLGHFERKGLPMLLEALAMDEPPLEGARLWVVGGEPGVVASYRATTERLGVAEACCVYLSDHGHMSAIDPIVGLHRARERGLLRDGAIVVMLAAGTGYSWGATAIRWGRA